LLLPLAKYQVGGRAASAWGIHIKYYLKELEKALIVMLMYGCCAPFMGTGS